MKNIYKFLLLISISLTLGCMSAAEHKAAIQNTDSDRLTAGKVQREIKVGMPSADVAEILGSPNMVTTDEKRREVWVYDKIATETVYSTSSGGVSSLILGGAGSAGLLGGLLGGGSANRDAGAASKTQRTLTVIIKFDENQKVRDFSYRQSSF
jgi:outer membrane protein assembly factor BamE (lipoprotein component of BamABCDE complex)